MSNHYEELLPAYADGGLTGDEESRVRAHVDGCAACRKEVAALRDILGAARRAQPVKEQDDAFFADFARDVRRRVADLPAPATGFLAWLRRPVVVVGFCAAAAVVLAFVYVKHHPEAERATPTVAGKGPAAPRPTSDPAKWRALDDENDLDADQAAKVLDALEPADEDEAGAPTDEEAMLGASRPESFLETLDPDELARVNARL